MPDNLNEAARDFEALLRRAQERAEERLRNDIHAMEGLAAMGVNPAAEIPEPVARKIVGKQEYNYFWGTVGEGNSLADHVAKDKVKTSSAKLKELRNKLTTAEMQLYQVNRNLLDVPSFVRAINKQLRRHKTVKFRLKTQVSQRELAAQIAEILWLASKDVDQIEVL